MSGTVTPPTIYSFSLSVHKPHQSTGAAQTLCEACQALGTLVVSAECLPQQLQGSVASFCCACEKY